jgi:hypothetical protein
MKPLVIFYTRYGHNITIAEAIARELGAELRRIQTAKQQHFMVMGACSSMNIPMRILPMDLDVSAFDPIVLCTPIWAGKPAPPARMFLRQADVAGRRLAVCLSTGGGSSARAQAFVGKLAQDRGAQVFAFGEIQTQSEDRESLVRDARAFADRLKQ